MSAADVRGLSLKDKGWWSTANQLRDAGWSNGDYGLGKHVFLILNNQSFTCAKAIVVSAPLSNIDGRVIVKLVDTNKKIKVPTESLWSPVDFVGVLLKLNSEYFLTNVPARFAAFVVNESKPETFFWGSRAEKEHKDGSGEFIARGLAELCNQGFVDPDRIESSKTVAIVNALSSAAVVDNPSNAPANPGFVEDPTFNTRNQTKDFMNGDSEPSTFARFLLDMLTHKEKVTLYERWLSDTYALSFVSAMALSAIHDECPVYRLEGKDLAFTVGSLVTGTMPDGRDVVHFTYVNPFRAGGDELLDRMTYYTYVEGSRGFATESSGVPKHLLSVPATVVFVDKKLLVVAYGKKTPKGKAFEFFKIHSREFKSLESAVRAHHHLVELVKTLVPIIDEFTRTYEWMRRLDKTEHLQDAIRTHRLGVQAIKYSFSRGMQCRRGCCFQCRTLGEVETAASILSTEVSVVLDAAFSKMTRIADAPGRRSAIHKLLSESGKLDEPCPVCLEPMTKKPSAMLACGHVFCEDCMTTLANPKGEESPMSGDMPTCPLCREPLA